MTTSPQIRPATQSDASAIAEIYNHFVRETVVTFEVDELSVDEMADRIGDIRSESLPWLVAEKNGHVLGYAYAGKWHARYAYRFTAESTVYLHPSHTGQGLGTQLYTELLATLRSSDLHTVIGGIALPNDASVALHEQFGFEQAAHYREVGFKFGKWIDVGYWQLRL